MFFGKNVRKRHGKDPELSNRLFLRLGIWRLKPCCFDWKTVCCGKVSRCDANETKLRLEVLVSFFNCYCAPRRTRKTTIPTICGWCAVCGLRARRFRHRTIFPPVFIRWAGPWCMRLGVDGNPRSWWHFNAWFRNGGHGAILFEYLDFAFCLCGAYRMGHRSSGIVQRKPGAGPYAFGQLVHPCGTRT